MPSLSHYRRRLQQLQEQRRAALAEAAREEQASAAACRATAAIMSAQQIAQSVAAAVQSAAHERIASVVSRCLEAVFPDTYTFRIAFEQKRGRTEARLLFLRGDQEVDPTTAAGGGVVDVAAFALRLACLLLSQPTARRLLVLDEPMRFINGSEAQARMAELLPLLCQELNLQIVLVSDDPWLRLGTVIDLE